MVETVAFTTVKTSIFEFEEALNPIYRVLGIWEFRLRLLSLAANAIFPNKIIRKCQIILSLQL